MALLKLKLLADDAGVLPFILMDLFKDFVETGRGGLASGIGAYEFGD